MELLFIKMEKIIRKEYLGEKDLEVGVLNMLSLRCSLDLRGVI